MIITNILGPLHWNRFEPISVEGVLIMLGALSFLLFIGKVMRKKPIQFPQVESLELEHYTFGFEETNTKVKKISLSTRVVLFVMTAILIYTPMYELLKIDYFNHISWACSLP